MLAARDFSCHSLQRAEVAGESPGCAAGAVPGALVAGPTQVSGGRGGDTGRVNCLEEGARKIVRRSPHLLSAHCVQLGAPPLHNSFLIQSSELPLR